MLKRIAPFMGMVGVTVFTLTFTLYGLFRPDYSPVRHYVSELAIGSGGWIQIVNFLLLGAFLMVFALGVRKTFLDGIASRAGPIMLMIIAGCYFISGPLVTDPLSMFDNQQTFIGMLHGIFGALVFALSPVCCFLYWRRFRADPRWRYLHPWTLAAVILMVGTVVLMKVAQPLTSALNPWAGLIQRGSLLTFYAWVFAFSVGLRKSQNSIKGESP